MLNWVECSKCTNWLLYENSGIEGSYDAAKVAGAVIECKNCTLKEKVFQLEKDKSSMMQRLDLMEKKMAVMESLEKEVKEKDQMISRLSEQVKELTDTREDLNNKIKELAEEKATAQLHKGTQESKQNCGSAEENLSNEQLRQASEEIAEIEYRKHNVVIWGLPENGKDKEDVINFVNNEHFSLSPINDDMVIGVERLGKAAPNKTRMLRVRLDGTDTKRKLLTIHRMRKNREEAPRVYIRPDLTKSQQEGDKRLREEWIRKGKDKFTIKRGKVVPRADGTGDNGRNGTNLRKPETMTEAGSRGHVERNSVSIEEVGTTDRVDDTVLRKSVNHESTVSEDKAGKEGEKEISLNKV